MVWTIKFLKVWNHYANPICSQHISGKHLRWQYHKIIFPGPLIICQHHFIFILSRQTPRLVYLNPILHTWIKDSTFISVLRILLVDVDDQNFQHFTAANRTFFYIKNCKLFIPNHPWRTSNIQKKLSVPKVENPTLQNMKFIDFFLFECTWVGTSPREPGDGCWGMGFLLQIELLHFCP